MWIRLRIWRRLLILLAVALPFTVVEFPQIRPTIIDPGEPFETSRPPAKKPAQLHPRPKYVGTSAETQEGATCEVGFTIWVLKTASSEPGLPRNSQRAESSTLFSPRTKLRLTIEVPQAGFLYVIDREKYVDGSLRNPVPLYPFRKGINIEDNRVSAGHLIEIPREAVFLVNPQKGEVAELITLIITPKAIPDLQSLAETAGHLSLVRLSSEQVSLWEKEWGNRSGKI